MYKKVCVDCVNRLEDAQEKRSKLSFNIDDSGFDVENLDGIPFRPIDTLVEANRIHKRTEIFFAEATAYFKMDGWVTDHIEVTQDMSRSWKHLAEFDTNFERRCKMHKRRIDLLLPVLLELNSQFYLQICRQIQFEIGEIYSEMTDLKIAIADNEGIFHLELFPIHNDGNRILSPKFVGTSLKRKSISNKTYTYIRHIFLQSMTE